MQQQPDRRVAEGTNRRCRPVRPLLAAAGELHRWIRDGCLESSASWPGPPSVAREGISEKEHPDTPRWSCLRFLSLPSRSGSQIPFLSPRQGLLHVRRMWCRSEPFLPLREGCGAERGGEGPTHRESRVEKTLSVTGPGPAPPSAEGKEHLRCDCSQGSSWWSVRDCRTGSAAGRPVPWRRSVCCRVGAPLDRHTTVPRIGML
jgi:hypothetical protein